MRNRLQNTLKSLVLLVCFTASVAGSGVIISSEAVAAELALATNPGECKCAAGSGIIDDSDCTSCNRDGQCPLKKCSVLVKEDGQEVIRKVSCEWKPPTDSCGGCAPRANWLVVTPCPSTAEQNHCGDYQCAMTKVGYTGPLVRGPNVRLEDCKKN